MPLIGRVFNIGALNEQAMKKAQGNLNTYMNAHGAGLRALSDAARAISGRKGATLAGHRFSYVESLRPVHDPARGVFVGRLFEATFIGSLAAESTFGVSVDIDENEQVTPHYSGAARPPDPDKRLTIEDQFVRWLQDMRLHFPDPT